MFNHRYTVDMLTHDIRSVTRVAATPEAAGIAVVGILAAHGATFGTPVQSILLDIERALREGAD